MTWRGWEDYTPPQQSRTGIGGRITIPQPPDSTPILAPKPRSKYGAVPHYVTPDLQLVLAHDARAELDSRAIRFDSKREAERYIYLRGELDAGRISDLHLQKQYTLSVINKDRVRVVIGRWIADFTYTKNGREVVEDAKGVRNALYAWKAKHVQAEYGIAIVEV